MVKSLIPDATYRGGLKVPSGKGCRFIINHLGSKNGFLKDCGGCFVGKKDSADYHSEMNSPHFKKWLVETVLPKMPDKTVLVIDNARYHSCQTKDSKKPTANWRKAKIQAWLKKINIPLKDLKDTKQILLEKSKSIHVPKKYILEKITKEYCNSNSKSIQILQLPIGHSELNPIEMIWAHVKSDVAKKNITFKMKDVQDLVSAALENVTSKNWSKVERHSMKVEDEFWKLDFNDREPTERFIIELGNDSESDESQSEDESDEDEYFD